MTKKISDFSNSSSVSKTVYTSYFNLLKFFGAILVTVYHLSIVYSWIGSNSQQNFFNIPNYALYNFKYLVEMFFVMSGYLAVKSYNKHGAIDIKSKAQRFYPAVIVTITLMYVVKLFFCNTSNSLLGHTSFLSYVIQIIFLNTKLFFSFNTEELNGPLWYLAILMICYLIINLSKNNRRVHIFLIIYGVLLVILNLNYPFVNFWIGRGLASFFLGCELYYFLGNKKQYALAEKAILSLCLLFLFLWLIGPYNIYYTLVLVLLSLGMTLLCECRTIEQLTNNDLCRFLGKASYYIYVTGALCYQGLYIIMYRINVGNNVSMYFALALLTNVVLGLLLAYMDNRKGIQ